MLKPNKLKKTILKLICSLSLSAIYTPMAFADCDFSEYKNGYGQAVGYVQTNGIVQISAGGPGITMGRVEFVKAKKLEDGVIEEAKIYAASTEYFQKDGKSYKRKKLMKPAGSIKMTYDQTNIYNAEGEQVAFLTGENTITSLEGHDVGTFDMDCSSSFNKKGKRVRTLSMAAAAFILSHVDKKAEEADKASESLLDL